MAQVKQYKTAAATIGIIITTTATETTTRVPRITTTTTTSRTTTGQMHELKAKDIKVKSSLGCFAPALPLLQRFPTWEYSHSTHWLNCECIIHEHRRRDGAEGQTQPANKTLCGSSATVSLLPIAVSLFLSLSLSLSPSQLSSRLDKRFALALALRQSVKRIDNCLVAWVKRGTNENRAYVMLYSETH